MAAKCGHCRSRTAVSTELALLGRTVLDAVLCIVGEMVLNLLNTFVTHCMYRIYNIQTVAFDKVPHHLKTVE